MRLRQFDSRVIVHTSPTKRSSDFIAHLEQLDGLYGPELGRAVKPVALVEDNGPIHVSKLTTAALTARSQPLARAQARGSRVCRTAERAADEGTGRRHRRARHQAGEWWSQLSTARCTPAAAAGTSRENPRLQKPTRKEYARCLTAPENLEISSWAQRCRRTPCAKLVAMRRNPEG